MESLVESVQKHGLIHPIVIAKRDDGRYDLIAGERRFRACLLLGWTEVPCMFREELPAIERKEIELEENIHRRNLVWSEQIEILRQIDELKRAIHGEILPGQKSETGWNLSKTADLAGKSLTQTSREISLARLLKERPDLKEKVENLPMNAAIRQAEQILERERTAALEARGALKFDWSLKLGDARTLIKELADESVDLIVTDPPYGIDKLEEGRGTDDGASNGQVYTLTMKESDNLTFEQTCILLRELAPELYRVCKPSAHIYVFHSAQVYQPLIDALREVGFLMDWAPLIWDKGTTGGPFLGYAYQATYEPILFGHKPPRTKRLAGAMKNILHAKPTSGKNKIHPFQKGPEIIKTLIEQSSLPGNVVLDPFAGSGETLVVARRLLRQGLGFELNFENFLSAQARLLKIDGKDVEASLPGDFREIVPRTPEWMAYWKAHPKKQQEMIEYMKELEKKGEGS